MNDSGLSTMTMMVVVMTTAMPPPPAVTSVVVVDYNDIASMVISTMMMYVAAPSNICSRRSISEAHNQEHCNQYQHHNRRQQSNVKLQSRVDDRTSRWLSGFTQTDNEELGPLICLASSKHELPPLVEDSHSENEEL